VKFPADHASATEGEGYKSRSQTLDAAASASPHKHWHRAGAFEAALSYAQQRQAFGHPNRRFSGHPVHACGHGHGIDAARLACPPCRLETRTPARDSRWKASIAKLFASEMATRVTHKAIQIHGGNGYSSE